MRILYFYQYFTTPKGAWGTRVYEFARRWVEAGDEVTVVTSVYDKSDLTPDSFVETFVVEGITVKVVNVRLSNKDGLLWRLWSFAAYAMMASWYALTLRADVVIASSGPITVGLPGLVARFVRRVPMIFEVRDLWPQGAIDLGYLQSRWIRLCARLFERLCYSSSTSVVALSEGMAEGVLAVHHSADVVVVPNASDNDLFGSPDADIVPEGYDASRALVLYTGTMGLADDCGQIVEGAKVLSERGRTDIELVMIGDGKERVALEQVVADYSLQNLRFLGLISKLEVAKWLKRATCALITFKAVPFTDTMSPNKMYDAFAAGVPIVQTTQGWIRRLTESKKCGISIPPNDPHTMADAIESLVDDSDMRGVMAANAKSLAESEFDRDMLAERMRQTLHRALERAK